VTFLIFYPFPVLFFSIIPKQSISDLIGYIRALWYIVQVGLADFFSQLIKTEQVYLVIETIFTRLYIYY